MSAYRLGRQSNVDLIFDGRLIAEASTFEEGRARWQEIRIYATDTGRWVVERLGRSSLEGEVDLPAARVCDTPEEVREALLTSDKGSQRRYLTEVAQDALEDAAAADTRLGPALVERV